MNGLKGMDMWIRNSILEADLLIYQEVTRVQILAVAVGDNSYLWEAMWKELMSNWLLGGKLKFKKSF